MSCSLLIWHVSRPSNSDPTQQKRIDELANKMQEKVAIDCNEVSADITTIKAAQDQEMPGNNKIELQRQEELQIACWPMRLCRGSTWSSYYPGQIRHEVESRFRRVPYRWQISTRILRGDTISGQEVTPFPLSMTITDARSIHF